MGMNTNYGSLILLFYVLIVFLYRLRDSEMQQKVSAEFASHHKRVSPLVSESEDFGTLNCRLFSGRFLLTLGF